VPSPLVADLDMAIMTVDAGAEQIAVRATDAGFEVVYQGIRLTPAQIVAVAVAEDGRRPGRRPRRRRRHRPRRRRPRADRRRRARVFTPKDCSMTEMVLDIVEVIRRAADRA
jgi:(2R)-ethylmalonyl-CoA mutase